MHARIIKGAGEPKRGRAHGRRRPSRATLLSSAGIAAIVFGLGGWGYFSTGSVPPAGQCATMGYVAGLPENVAADQACERLNRLLRGVHRDAFWEPGADWGRNQVLRDHPDLIRAMTAGQIAYLTEAFDLPGRLLADRTVTGFRAGIDPPPPP